MEEKEDIVVVDTVTLGRAPSRLESMVMADGYVPVYRIGNPLKCPEGQGKVDGIVLFTLPDNQAIWGYRLEGFEMYYPQNIVGPVENV